MASETQSLVGAVQYTGLAAAGLFVFSTRFSNLPRSTRIVINGVSYTELQAGPVLTTDVWARFVRPPGNIPTAYAAIGRGLAAENLLSPIDGAAELFLCGRPLPRNPGVGGAFWDLLVFTQNKSQTATVMVDYLICPFNETDPRDSQQ